MSVDWKKALILLLILLVCSVTPITAVERKQVNSTSDSYTYAQLYSDSRNILSEFIEAEDVKLTLEQSAYLEAHQGRLRTKAEVRFNQANPQRPDKSVCDGFFIY